MTRLRIRPTAENNSAAISPPIFFLTASKYVGDLGIILFQLSEGLGLNTRGVADKSIS